VIRLATSIIGGVELGGTFALIALGIVLAFRATKIFNFAQGEFLLLPAFIIGYAQVHQVPLGESLVIAFAVNAVLGIAFYLLVLNRTTNLPLFMGIIATLGLAAILDGVMGILFQVGQYEVVIPGVPRGSFTVFGAGVSEEALFFGVFTLVLAGACALFIRFTHVGLSLTAAGQNALLASQCGLQVRRLHAISWAVAAILAAVAGISYGTATVANTSMVSLGLAALPAIMLGGLDSIEGAIAGGVIVGLMESFAATYLGGQYVNLVTYALLLVVLLVRPQGLFGSKEVVRA
jgi:branched-chain amino acid transport system permease protein